jgi:hypothetical protein
MAFSRQDTAQEGAGLRVVVDDQNAAHAIRLFTLHGIPGPSHRTPWGLAAVVILG